MTNLTPVPRTDKTGKTVIRHMNLAGRGSETKAIPKPVAAAPRSRRERSTQMLSKQLAAMIGKPNAWDKIPYDVLSDQENWESKLGSLSDETISGFHEILSSKNKRGIVEFLASALAVHGDDPDEIGNLMFATRFSTDRSSEWGAHESRALTSARLAYDGLGAYEKLGFVPPQSVLDAPDEIKSKTSALLRAKNTADDLGGVAGRGIVMNLSTGEVHLVLPLANLIIERHDDIERICDIMQERQTVDPELIASILDTASPALSEGIL